MSDPAVTLQSTVPAGIVVTSVPVPEVIDQELRSYPPDSVTVPAVPGDAIEIPVSLGSESIVSK